MATSTQNIVATSSDEKLKEPDDMKEEVIAVGHPAEAVGQSRSFGSESDPPICMPNLYVLGSQTKCYEGYDNYPGEWDDFSLYGNTKESNSKFPGTYNHHAAHQFHNAYGYNMQMPCGIYSPVTSLNGVLHSEAGYRAIVDRRADPVFQGSQLDGTSSLSSSGRGNLPGNPGGVSFLDQQRVSEGSRSNGLWSDWPKPLDRHHPLSLASQQPRPFYGFGSHSPSYKDRTRAHCVNQGGIPGNGSYKLGIDVGDWHGLNHGRHFGLGNGSLCSCSSAIDNLNEHNRGPRASKSKRQLFTETYLQVDGNRNTLSPRKLHNASYNNPDLIVQCMDAKIFVIKSYSEDNIYKSIKYSVWASTPNGNQKLNTAYHEAKEKLNRCPIFLFFSVNASAQFCGVAEMVGPVDFEKSVDYWQQDKWSGQFPVKWHVIKDVPNSQFRHIVLEYNDNKPVTNSRDTQEVKLEQGVEMLNIFKNYETNISILDDFDYYEGRHKALKERKSREHSSFSVNGTNAGTEKRNAAIESNELIEKVSQSFAQVVRLRECNKNTSYGC